MKNNHQCFAKIFPEQNFIGFNRREGRFVFYSIVADLLKPKNVLVDFGAGRGHQIETSRGHMRYLTDFRGRAAQVIGVDPDPIVMSNPYLDHAIIMDADGSVALPDESVDIVVSFAVLEHVPTPKRCAEEIFRILKPGGWFCAWTPNKWGYVGLAARLIPNALHARLLRAVEPGGRKENDVFPTHYRLNSRAAIRRAFNSARFTDYSFTYNGQPSYNFGKVGIARLWMLWMLLSPSFARQSLLVFVQKRSDATGSAAGTT